jgi:hypothetical protein
VARCQWYSAEGRCKRKAKIDTSIIVDRVSDEVIGAFVVKCCMDHTAWLRFSLEEEPDDTDT